MRKLTFLFLILSFQSTYSQSIYDKLKEVTTKESAEKFVLENPQFCPEIYDFSPDIDTPYLTEFETNKVGNVFRDDYYIYKVLSINKAKACCLKYIYLDGSKLSIEEINNLRTEIINKYQNGVAFSELIKNYTMDYNYNQEKFCTLEGQFYPKFEKEYKIHNVGDIYTTEIESEKWYYVALKTSNEIEVSRVELLRLRSPL